MASIVGDHKNDNCKAAAAHVLVIPQGLHGHIAPLLQLAIQLARQGITITFVSFQDAIDQIASAEDGSGSELQRLDFRLVGLRKPEISLDRQGASDVKDLKEASKPLREKLIHDKRAGIAGPTSILSDMFLPWTQEWADALEIPRYMFVPSGVIFARFMQGLLDYYESGQFQYSEMDGGKPDSVDWQVCISGLPPLHYYELPTSIRKDPAEFRENCASVGQAAGLLVNSFLELEGKVIDNWKNSGGHIKVPKIYLVGPLVSTSVALPNVRNGPVSDDSASKCLLFLGSQAPSSVLYVAFGSRFKLSPEQIKELALGLEDSEQHFLLVIPLPKDSSGEQTPSLTEILPPGFETRLGQRGCIVTGWAPQVQILAHSSTGGFLTHSGWNSSLESIIMGVPMISCPQTAEQYLNCKYLVNEVKIAIALSTGPQNVFKRKEVERVVRLLMVESEGKAIRRRVEELRTKARAAVAEGGSKSRVFQEFSDDIGDRKLSSKSDSK